jgi:hypothetical protein
MHEQTQILGAVHAATSAIGRVASSMWQCQPSCGGSQKVLWFSGKCSDTKPPDKVHDCALAPEHWSIAESDHHALWPLMV